MITEKLGFITSHIRENRRSDKAVTLAECADELQNDSKLILVGYDVVNVLCRVPFDLDFGTRHLLFVLHVVAALT